MRRWVSLLILMVLALIFAAVTGRLTAQHVDDTPSYVNYPFGSFSAALTSQRTPGYPIFISAIDLIFGMAMVPTIQWLLVCLAGWCLACELMAWNASPLSGFCAAMAIVFGCTSIDNQSILSTDALAASVGVFVVSSLLRWVRRQRGWFDGGVVVLASVAAIMIRPAYLSLIPWLLIAATLLCHRRLDELSTSLSRRMMSSVILSGSAAAFIVCWMLLRLVVVDDFGMLPFGHQNLAGVTVQLVSDVELLGVSEMTEPLAGEIIRQREIKVAQGYDFSDQYPIAYMRMESRWNDLIYQVVVPAIDGLTPNDPIKSHREIGALNVAIITEYPLRYVRWLMLAGRRAAWAVAADMVMNPFFLAAIIAVVGWLFWRAIGWQQKFDGSVDAVFRYSSATLAMFIVASSYFVVMVGFVILTSPPLGRFSDACAIFLPVCLVMVTIETIGSSRQGSDFER